MLKAQVCGLLAVLHRRANAFLFEIRLICAHARTLAKQPALITNTMIQHISISEFVFNYRSVFILAARRILEGERDYADQALATATLQRLCVIRGVVHVVLVSVKV